MGTLRWEKEESDRQIEKKKQIESERKRIELELAESEINAKIQALKKQLEANRSEIERLSEQEKGRIAVEERKFADIQKLRGADVGEEKR